jgi:hypothetical protein
MRNHDFVSDGFLALIAAGLLLLCSSLTPQLRKRNWMRREIERNWRWPRMSRNSDIRTTWLH